MTVYDDNPLMGEYPDVPARSGVQAVLGAADRVAGAVQAVAEIRELAEFMPHSAVSRRINTILDKWGLR